jgi:hypothetical protein
MSRDVTAGMLTAADAAVMNPILLFEGNFPSGFLRLWSGLGPLGWAGETWTGGGTLVSIAPAEETVELAAAGARFVLDGIDTEIVAIALGEDYQGRACKLWFGALDADGAVIADPVPLFAGRMDVMRIDDAGETASITLTAENRLIALERPKPLRYTAEEQRAAYPDDAGLDFIAELQNREVIWK